MGFMTRRYRSNHIYSATGTARQVRQSPHRSLVSQSVGVGAATLTLRRFAHVRLKAAQIAPGHQMTLRPRECRDQPAMNTFEWRRPAHQPLSLPLPPSPRCLAATHHLKTCNRNLEHLITGRTVSSRPDFMGPTRSPNSCFDVRRAW